LECSAARLLFDRYLENQLTPVQRKVFEDHLDGCSNCSLELKRIHRVFDVVDEYFQRIRPKDGFFDDVMVGVEEASEHRRRRSTKPRPVVEGGSRGRGVKILAALAAVVILAGAAYFLLPRDSSIGEIVEVARSAQRRGSPDASWSEVFAGARVRGGDSIRSDGGTTRVHLEDRTEVVLGSAAVLTLGASAKGRPARPRVDEGAVSFRVVEGEQGVGPEVAIPAGSVSVVSFSQGQARFSVEIEPEGGSKPSLVEVLKGEVKVETESGNQVVREGQRCEIREGTAPSRPVPIRTAVPPPDRGRRTRREPGVPSRVPAPERDPKPATVEPTKEVPLRDLVARVQDLGGVESDRIEALRLLASRAAPENAPELRAVLLDVLRNDGNENVRIAAFTTLAGLGTENLYYDMLAIFDGDPSVALRRKALEEIVKFKDQERETHSYLIGALRALFTPDVQPLKMDIVREIAKSPAVEDLGSLLDAFHASAEEDPVRPEILKALGGYKFPETVDALLAFVRDSGPSDRAAAIASLRQLTGQSFGYAAAAEEDPVLLDEVIGRWETWWAENRDTFDF
jgi:hypothetical protein